MIVLSDNDIVYKIAYCDLFEEFLAYLQVPSTSVLILPTCIHKLRRQLKNHAVVLTRLEAICRRVTVMADDVADSGVLEMLMSTGADAGESLLAARVAATPDAILVTGDKRAIQAFVRLPAGMLRHALSGRILCFEELIIGMLCKHGFGTLSPKLIAGSQCDGVLRMAFGVGRTEAHALSCLSSYADDLRKNTSVFLTKRP